MHGSILRLRERLYPLPEGQYLIGLSGGADSVALLCMLLPDIRDGRILADAIHVNHGLRGAESDEDERFTAELCREEGIRLISRKADLDGRTDESAAREARYAVFREAVEETGAEGLILAHHADDQAETFLMRLFRGAGPAGLSCMKPEENVFGVRVLRPMLGLRRDEIRTALREDGTAWREDSSNLDRRYLRNRVRLDLIPEMEKIAPDAVRKICQASMLIAEDAGILDREARGMLSRLSDGKLIDAESLRKVPAALRSRVLRLWWQEYCPDREEHSLSRRQTTELMELLERTSGKINLPGGMNAVRGIRYLHLTGKPEIRPETAVVSGEETVFGDFLLRVTPSEGTPGDGKRCQEVPAGFIDGCVIRNRKPGDRIRPFGADGSRKLQDYLTDRRVDEPFRDRIPLLCRGSEVLLAAGVGAGNIPTWNPNIQTVRLSWIGEMPWMEKQEDQ